MVSEQTFLLCLFTVESVSIGNNGSIESIAIRHKLLQEIEKLVAIAYKIFKDSPPVLIEEPEPNAQFHDVGVKVLGEMLLHFLLCALRGYAQNGHLEEALKMFWECNREGDASAAPDHSAICKKEREYKEDKITQLEFERNVRNDIRCLRRTVDPSSKENSVEIVAPSIKGNPQIKTFDVSAPPVDASSSLAVQVVDQETLKCNLEAENDIVTVELLAKKETLEMDRIVSEHEREESNKKLTEEQIEADVSPKASIQSDQPEETSSLVTRVDDQLDEAQGLLKIEYKSENAQLEELLIAEREEKNAFDARVKQLQREISLARATASVVEAKMADMLASKNTEIEALITSMQSLKKQVVEAKGKLATLQANTEVVMRNQQLTETRMIQVELASTERRAREEHVAHNATQMAAMEREAPLNHLREDIFQKVNDGGTIGWTPRGEKQIGRRPPTITVFDRAEATTITVKSRQGGCHKRNSKSR
eukprot:Gb_16119 [translate_table: standard]